MSKDLDLFDGAYKGKKVLVWAPGVAKPTAVRFGWHEAAQPNLFSSAGLPARPFRTDKPAAAPAGGVSSR